MTPVSYFFLWFFLFVSLAVYGVDIFTAVNLLAFSKWAGQIKPTIPFNISRWIFAVCIIISFVLLVVRWLHAIRAIRSGSIAHSYLDSLAVRIQSIRMGSKGRGWKRFLVFAELTKSRKGAEYVALFSYFSFETWMNTIFADGPRQVVNAITLWSVMQMDLIPGGKNAAVEDDKPAALQFFDNIRILAEDNNLRAVVLLGMLFTVVIWVLSMLKLILAVLLYLIFLFHHIPAEDGTLKAYCRRKVNSRLKRIVTQKVNKALSKGLALQDRKPTQPDLNPTLPSLEDTDKDKGPHVTVLSRSTTQTTLPPYTSRPGTAAPDQDATLPNLGWSADTPDYSEPVSLGGAAAAYSPLDRQSSSIPPVPPLPTMPAVQSNSPVPRPPTSQARYTPTPPGSINGPGRTTPMSGFRSPSPGPNSVFTGTYTPFQMGQHNPHPTPYRPYSPAIAPPGRSLTPGVAISGNFPGRTFSPVAHSATPPAGYPGRSFTPVGTPQFPKIDRYAVFDPSMTSRTPPPRNQTQSPAYHPYDGINPRSKSPQPHF